MIPLGATVTFESPWTLPPDGQPPTFFDDRNGTPAEVIAHYTTDDETHNITEVGPMYRVRFADGVEVEAWPEELEDNNGR